LIKPQAFAKTGSGHVCEEDKLRDNAFCFPQENMTYSAMTIGWGWGRTACGRGAETPTPFCAISFYHRFAKTGSGQTSKFFIKTTSLLSLCREQSRPRQQDCQPAAHTLLRRRGGVHAGAAARKHYRGQKTPLLQCHFMHKNDDHFAKTGSGQT